jgi:hypothetical protein
MVQFAAYRLGDELASVLLAAVDVAHEVAG